MEEGKRAVMLSLSLVKRIEEKIKDSNYASVSNYVEDVLSEVLKAEDVEVHQMDKEKMEQTREKLKQLGYLD